MKIQREVYQRHSYNETARYALMVFSKGNFLESLDTVIKPQNKSTTQLDSSIVFKCLLPKLSKRENKSFIIPFL